MDIIVVIHDNVEEVIKKLRLDLDPKEYINSRAFTFTDYVTGKLEVYMWFRSTDIDYNTIFHEHTHVLAYFGIHRDIKFDPDNDEPYAYFGGYIGAEIMSIIDKFKIKAL